MKSSDIDARALARDPAVASTKPSQTRLRASQPLRTAIELGNLDLVQHIIQEGVNLDAGYSDCDGCTALLYCLYNKRQEIAEYIALQGASPVGKVCGYHNSHGLSVFHIAAQNNYSGLLKILLDLQSSRYRKLQHSAHPLHFAVQNQAAECVELMIGNAENGKTPSML